MAAVDLMALAHDKGFRRKVEFALFDVAKDKAVGTPAGDDLIYLNAILNGTADFDPAITAVVVINSGAESATDAQLKANAVTLWPFLARAWVVRTL